MKAGPENKIEAKAAVNPVTIRSLRQRIKYVHMPWLEKASFDGVNSVILVWVSLENQVKAMRRKNSQLLVF